MKKLLLIVAAAVLLSALLGGCGEKSGETENTPENKETTLSENISEKFPESEAQTETDAAETAESDENTLTSLEVIRLMGNGINLGNTLEAYGHKNYTGGADPDGMETLWGQPYTTPEMIQGMKDAGFDTIRIPVAWTNGMNFESGDYTIDERLMNRVDTVVNYALDADMYVIINDHWDGSWWGMFGAEDMETREKAMEMYKSMWTQIGEHFKDYSYKLIFEAANEELGDRLNDSDITGSKGVLNKNECYEKSYEINSEFVKTVRSIGGRNEQRFLLIAGYNTDISLTCDDRFKMPEDTADSKLLLSVHYYTPWDYCGTDGVNQWGSPTDYEEQNGLFEKLSKFSAEGYGVVIGEYAVMLKNGGIKPDTDKFYSNLLYNCDLYDYCPVLWDCSNFYNRKTLSTTDEALTSLFLERRYDNEKDKNLDDIKNTAKEKIAEAYEAAKEQQSEDIEFPPSDDMAIAWIMFASSDYGISYSVGDTYDPTAMTTGIKAQNCQVTGDGTYTVSLDFSECGTANGVAFSALGISNGEQFFPNSVITIDEILINGEPYELQGKEYTCSDDSRCTRVNLYNAWVGNIPASPRSPEGKDGECSATIMDLGDKKRITSISITFTIKT